MADAEMGPMEAWVRRWGHPDESGERVWFTGEINVFDEQTGTPDTIVPILDQAREIDRQLSDLRAAGAELRSIISNTGPKAGCSCGDCRALARWDAAVGDERKE